MYTRAAAYDGYSERGPGNCARLPWVYIVTCVRFDGRLCNGGIEGFGWLGRTWIIDDGLIWCVIKM